MNSGKESGWDGLMTAKVQGILVHSAAIVVSDDAHLLADFSERCNRFVNLGWGVRSGQLCSNPCLVFGHNWIAEANNIDVVLHELFSHLCGLARISDHDWGNRAIIVPRDGETGRFQALSKLGSVCSERIDQVC